MDRDTETKPRADTGERRSDHRPRVADALKSGGAVSVTTWSGREVRGTVSDRDPAGLLLDVDGASDGTDGYVFLPWSSVERVDIRAVAPRRVKVLQG